MIDSINARHCSFPRRAMPYLVVSVVALAIIASGATLLGLHINALAGEILLGAGTLLGMGGILLLATCKKRSENTYKIVTWNIGSQGDFAEMQHMKKLTAGGMNLEDAFNALPKERQESRVLDQRKTLLKVSLTQFQSFDVLCLQQTFDFCDTDLQAMLPSNFTFFRFNGSYRQAGSVVAWDSSRFALAKLASIDYDDESIGFDASPDTFVLLQEKSTRTKISVVSSFLRPFNLAAKNYLSYPNWGDYQLDCNLTTMAQTSADLHIFAGDFGVTHDLYPQRLEILEKAGYETPSNGAPTWIDARFKPARSLQVDHIYVKGATAIYDDPRGNLYDFNRPSDHLPIAATVTY